MSRSHLHSQIARATGESLRTVAQRGFSVLRLEVPLRPATKLRLSCPGCGNEVAIATAAPGKLPEWAECDRCDIAFPYDDRELFLPDEELAASA